MEDDKEYREAVHKFFEIYHPLAKAYNLRMHTHFSIYDEGLIEVHQYIGDKRGNQIIKVTREDSAECYKRAAEELEHFKEKMEETAKKVQESRKERKIC